MAAPGGEAATTGAELMAKAAKELPRWRIVLIREHGRPLGTVRAKTAEKQSRQRYASLASLIPITRSARRRAASNEGVALWLSAGSRPKTAIPAESEDDELLLSGEWVVGRMLRESGKAHTGRVAWIWCRAGQLPRKAARSRLRWHERNCQQVGGAWQQSAGVRDNE